MGCGCQKAKPARRVSWELTRSDGTTQQFDTRLAADVARMSEGGKVRPVEQPRKG